MGMVQIKIEAGESGEMLGYVMAEEANAMLEEDGDDEIAKKLYTVGRELIEENRDTGGEIEEDDEEVTFEGSLFKAE